MRTALKVGALIVVGVVMAAVVGLWTFTHDERTVVVGAHTATVTPTFDGHATLEFGPLLPRLRIPTEQPGGVGARLDFKDSDADSVSDLVVRDAVILSQPQGEIDKVARTVLSLAEDAAIRGTGAGILAMLVAYFSWRAVGTRRRAELLHRLTRKPTKTRVTGVVAGGLAVVVAVTMIIWPRGAEPESALQADGWQPLRALYPQIKSTPAVDTVEVSKGTAAKAGVTLVDGMIKTYQTSVKFYGEMADGVPDIADQLHQPAEDETVALLVSDRHDNIGMDPVAAAVGKAGGATLLIDAGDDTSSGGSWEDFSINSMRKHFEDFDKLGIAGNHDSGTFVINALEDAGFTVLDGEPVDVDGIRFLGDSDPRASSFTAGYDSEGTESLDEMDERLTKAVCDDGDVSTVVVHSPTSAKKLAASGCVDLVLSGHLHRQVGPTALTDADGRRTVTFTNGTTGGAAYAIALGSKLRREAQATLVTYRDGHPVGLQPINFEPSGAIKPERYVSLQKRSEPSDDTTETPATPTPATASPAG